MSKEKKSVTKELKRLLNEIKEKPEAIEDLNKYVKSCLIPSDSKDPKSIGKVRQRSQALFKYYNNKSKKNPSSQRVEFLRTAIAWSGYRGVNTKSKKLTALLAVPMIIEIGEESKLPPILDKDKTVELIGASLAIPNLKDESGDDDANKVGILTSGRIVSPQHNMTQLPQEASQIVADPKCYQMRPVGVHYRFIPVMFELPGHVQSPQFKGQPVELENYIKETLEELMYRPKVVKVLNIIEMFDVWNLYDLLMKRFREEALAKQREAAKTTSEKE